MATQPRPARDHCSVCGYPLHGPKCDVCGVEGEAPVLKDADRRTWPRQPDPMGLEAAVQAWRAREFARAISETLAESKITSRTLPGPEGPAWIATVGRAPVFITLGAQANQVSIEVPVARVPLRHRVAVLRAALELSAEEKLTARFCLRDDLLVLRYVGRIAGMSPALLRDAVLEIGELACSHRDHLEETFDARPPVDAEADALTFAALGRSRKLKQLVPRDRSIPPPPIRREEEQRADAVRPKKASSPPARPAAPTPIMPPPQAEKAQPNHAPAKPAAPAPILADPVLAAAPAPSIEKAASPPPAAVQPAPLTLETEAAQPVFELVNRPPPTAAPKLRAQHATAPMLPKPLPVPKPGARSTPSAAFQSDSADALPPILAPALANQPRFDERKRTTGPAVDAVAPAEAAPAPAPVQTGGLRKETPGAGGSFPSTLSGQRPSAAAKMPEINFDPIARRSTTDGGVVEPEDRLCELLQKALVLANMLGPRSDTTRWLLRSTAFRAYYEFNEAVPDAVAQLYRAAARDPHTPEVPIQIIEKIVRQRAVVPKEKPLNIDPMTSSSQAKDHAARYLTEIEAAPSDMSLRHFLALGALAELMVRTKLPAPTEQRLRDIVSHARREGPRTTSVELLMTALQRIMGG